MQAQNNNFPYFFKFREFEGASEIFFEPHDVTAAILVYQNNETAAMSVFKTIPEGVQLFSYAKTLVPIKLHGCWPCGQKTLDLLPAEVIERT